MCIMYHSCVFIPNIYPKWLAYTSCSLWTTFHCRCNGHTSIWLLFWLLFFFLLLNVWIHSMNVGGNRPHCCLCIITLITLVVSLVLSQCPGIFFYIWLVEVLVFPISTGYMLASFGFSLLNWGILSKIPLIG